MGRKKLGKHYKKPSDYTYDYPEQRELAKTLRISDKSYIARLTGYSETHISYMCDGKRRMKPEVKQIIEKLNLMRREIETEILNNQ